jgi:RNA polymerase sigma factor (sigma-70 family)
MTDNEILIGLRQNDRQIMEYLYKKLAPPIYAHVRDNGGDRIDFQDLYQDTFLKVLQNIQKGSYKPQQKFDAWFFTIAKNTWADKHRKQKKMLIEGDENLLLALALADESEISKDALRKLMLHDKKLEALHTVWGCETWTDTKCHRFLNAYHYGELSLLKIAEQEDKLNGKTIEELKEEKNKQARKDIQTNIGVQLKNCRKKLFLLVSEQLKQLQTLITN